MRALYKKELWNAADIAGYDIQTNQESSISWQEDIQGGAVRLLFAPCPTLGGVPPFGGGEEVTLAGAARSFPFLRPQQSCYPVCAGLL